MSEKLITFSSEYIVDFVSRNPIDWAGKQQSDRGGAGDILTPTPAVLEFINLLKQKDGLFTQDEYVDYCLSNPTWRDWLSNLTAIQRNGARYSAEQQISGLRFRLKRNFYPSMIDTLHAWALLSGAGWFDVCYLDTFNDVVGKIDLTLKKGDVVIKLALLGPYQAVKDREYKKRHRGNSYDYRDTVEIKIPADRLQSPGNKRWYILDDFSEINPNISIAAVNQAIESGELIEVHPLDACIGDIRVWAGNGSKSASKVIERQGNFVKVAPLTWASLLPDKGSIKVYRHT